MALVLKDRVKETTSTSGTGSVTLAGAVQGFQGFSSVGDGNTTYYTIAGVAEWEVGIGTYSAGVLSRDTVLGSSANGDKVAFSSGVKDVFCTLPAGKAVVSDTLPVTLAFNVASPNATVNVSSLTSAAASTNGDLALAPKGTGALLGQVPTGTAAGGNKRGTYSVDLQLSRANAADVASGNSSVISGGYANKASGSFEATVGGGSYNAATGIRTSILGGHSNTASGNGSTIVGGLENTSSNTNSFVGGGRGNVASGDSSVITGGFENTASASYTVAGGGQSNTASGLWTTVSGGLSNTASGTAATVGGGGSNQATAASSTVAGGSSNVASAQSATIAGGSYHVANAAYSVVSGGAYGTTRGIVGYHAFPACNVPVWDDVGKSQKGLLILGTITTNATTQRLRSDTAVASATNQLTLPNNSAYYIQGSVIASRTGAAGSKSWRFEVQMKRGANAASTVVGSIVSNPFEDAGTTTWSIALSADTTNGGLAIDVTGQASTTIRWVCRLETTEVAF